MFLFELVHLDFVLKALNHDCQLLDLTLEGKELLAKSNNLTKHLHNALLAFAQHVDDD
jgi:hypothetical protein